MFRQLKMLKLFGEVLWRFLHLSSQFLLLCSRSIRGHPKKLLHLNQGGMGCQGLDETAAGAESGAKAGAHSWHPNAPRRQIDEKRLGRSPSSVRRDAIMTCEPFSPLQPSKTSETPKFVQNLSQRLFWGGSSQGD